MLEGIVTALNRTLGPNDLVIASVDFSHYQPLPVAEAEDARTRRALEAFDAGALASLAADSPNSLWLAFRFAQRRGARQVRIVDHSNSAPLLGDPRLPSTTSYFSLVWR